MPSDVSNGNRKQEHRGFKGQLLGSNGSNQNQGLDIEKLLQGLLDASQKQSSNTNEDLGAGNTSRPQGENAFFDSLLARRGRAIQDFSRGQSHMLSGNLASRGLLGSGIEARGNLAIQQQAGQSFSNAAQDIAGQQFAAQQQRATDAAAFNRQAALMRLQHELNKPKRESGGGLFGKLLGGLGGAAAGFLTGGPAGAVVGGLSGLSR